MTAQPGNAPARLHGDRLTIALAEDVDCGSAATLATRVQAILTAGHTRHLTIDLAGMEFCDSAGVRVLKQLHRAAADRGVTMTVRRPRPHIRWLLETLDATHLLDEPPPPHGS